MAVRGAVTTTRGNVSRDESRTAPAWRAAGQRGQLQGRRASDASADRGGDRDAPGESLTPRGSCGLASRTRRRSGGCAQPPRSTALPRGSLHVEGV